MIQRGQPPERGVKVRIQDCHENIPARSAAQSGVVDCTHHQHGAIAVHRQVLQLDYRGKGCIDHHLGGQRCTIGLELAQLDRGIARLGEIPAHDDVAIGIHDNLRVKRGNRRARGCVDAKHIAGVQISVKDLHDDPRPLTIGQTAPAHGNKAAIRGGGQIDVHRIGDVTEDRHIGHPHGAVGVAHLEIGAVIEAVEIGIDGGAIGQRHDIGLALEFINLVIDLEGLGGGHHQIGVRHIRQIDPHPILVKGGHADIRAQGIVIGGLKTPPGDNKPLRVDRNLGLVLGPQGQCVDHNITGHRRAIIFKDAHQNIAAPG